MVNVGLLIDFGNHKDRIMKRYVNYRLKIIIEDNDTRV